jgi:membrane protease YdiL (CAAX protease family)
MKFAVYAAFPAGDTFEFMIRDSVLDLPRLLAGSAAFYYAWKKYGKERLGLHERGGLVSLLVLGMLLLSLMVDGFNPSPPPLPIFLILGLSSFVVGFHEEFVFRGLCLEALKDLAGERVAFWLSSLLFTVFHYKAQPLVTWPGIFVAGLLFARMRLDGISIWCLIFIHGTYDALWFLLESYEPSLGFLLSPALTLLIYALYCGVNPQGRSSNSWTEKYK